MASLQAICSICERTVTAFTVLSDNDLKPLLERNEEIFVGHASADSSGHKLDHRWSLGDKEKQSLRKLINFMVGDKGKWAGRLKREWL